MSLSKRDWRPIFRAARRMVKGEERARLSDAVKNVVLALPFVARAESVMAYLAMEEEVETRPLVRALLESGKRVAVPSVNESDALVALALDSPDAPMTKGKFGIEEPRERKEMPPDSLDVVLAPGVGFDVRGGRLGFGAGYYDEFLGRTPAVRVGIAYARQVSRESVPMKPDDVFMDFVVTEKGVFARGNPPEEFLLPAERTALLRAARRSLEAMFRGEAFREAPDMPFLARAAGAFVTLRVDGVLRGCIGHVEAHRSLWSTVAECARAAAQDDPRFDSVSHEESPRLSIEISVLSSLRPIHVEEVDVGRHGLVVSRGPMRGLLLPQVPVEHGWGREEFLDHTCRKAGLRADAWREPGTRLEAFTAQVFCEQ